MDPRVAYFSMEVGLESSIPTYSGGLGVLAGDTLRSCADLGLPVVGVTLVHRGGYFRQSFGDDGSQGEVPDPWRPEERLESLTPRVEVSVAGRRVLVRAFVYRIVGDGGAQVDTLLLDTDLPENSESDRRLTDRLYGGDDAHRLSQEVVLGIGGVRMLRALGRPIDCYHLNEGHAALAVTELLAEQGEAPAPEAVEAVRRHCVFTTHTPVPAGHDRFSPPIVEQILGEGVRAGLARFGHSGELNMTALALDGARFVNGVAMRHGEVSRQMFPNHRIRSITNGVHPQTWASPAMSDLFDRHVPHWRSDPFSLRGLAALDLAAIADAHRASKQALIARVAAATGDRLDPEVLTLGFARRATAYKRPMLLLRDPERLARIAKEVGPLQLVFAGKAHPHDEEGRRLLREIHRWSGDPPKGVRAVLLPGYDMELGALVTAGCDVWVNTPIPPLEASGTSGMKAALNGVPSLSVPDGWWVEGCVEGVTGWAVGEDGRGEEIPASRRDAADAAALYDKLETAVATTFYADSGAFTAIRRQAIALNGSYFHTQRMVLEYLYEAYQGRSVELLAKRER